MKTVYVTCPRCGEQLLPVQVSLGTRETEIGQCEQVPCSAADFTADETRSIELDAFTNYEENAEVDEDARA